MTMPINIKTYGIIYTEYGYEILGDMPNEKQIAEIELKSNKYVAKCKRWKDEYNKIQSELRQDLWKASHPIQALWKNIIRRSNV